VLAGDVHETVETIASNDMSFSIVVFVLTLEARYGELIWQIVAGHWGQLPGFEQGIPASLMEPIQRGHTSALITRNPARTPMNSI
jgi:hypothetical protein